MQIIALGGLGEIGKNMMAFCCDRDIVVVDAGLAFPEEDMLGIDIVLPDISFLIEHRDRVRGIVLTHGHEDHIGAIPYVLKDLSPPIYGTRLALGLVRKKLAEHGRTLPEGSGTFGPGDVLRLGRFTIHPFRVNHSIADAVGLAIETPVGLVIHSGDFKFDHTPVDGDVAEFNRLAQWGDRGVMLLLSDSTNAPRPGFTPSEKTVGMTLDGVMRDAKRRVLVATFASNVHRIQQVVNTAHAHGRKVAVVGRSIENTVEVALELGYLEVPEGTLIPIEETRLYPPHELAIITTGSQGEPMSALTRMSASEHRRVEIEPGDTVVIAASPIPGNEKMVYRTIDNLTRLGAHVLYDRIAPVHVSGHASQEELKLMLNLVRPRHFIPLHGEYRHMKQHALLAEAVGVPPENIQIGENGTVFELSSEGLRNVGRVQAGRVFVDGLGVGDVGNIVLRDRKQLSQDGILVVVIALEKGTGALVGGPDIVSRGFVYVRESEALLDEARQRVSEALQGLEKRQVSDWSALKNAARDALGRYLFERTRRRPMILPIILEI